MLLQLATKIFGSSNERMLKGIQKHIDPINALESKFEKMSDDELRGQTELFRERLKNGETEDDILHEAFAVVREAAKRTLGLRPYDVQLIGGIVLHEGKIAEMKTGEGKTLVATMPVYLNALSGKGVHVVTVNDYLAQRDAEWMGQVYEFLGLSVGCISSDMYDDERRVAYGADITYGTNNEFGFDFLRDNMKYTLDEMVMRDFNFAIVDEVDSILIDEARTPLIISGPSEETSELYVEVDKIIPSLSETDYDLDEKMRTVNLSDEGAEHAEELLRQEGILQEGGMYDAHNIALVHHVNQALRAHKLFHLDEDYIIHNGQVVIIDEFTGRMMEGRRFSEGLHQALEAKERVEIQNENQTLASITFQNFFRMYPKLAGMTGTALSEAHEFAEIYKLGVLEIPTNVPVQRLDHDDKIYKNLQEKHDAITALIKECQERNQPALVGTTSIEKSEALSKFLTKEKIKHKVLNARYHEQEAFIVAQAGRPGAITIATNMAGRGTDIKLGGNVEMRVAEEVDESWDDAKKQKAIEKIKEEVKRDEQIVKDAGGLYVIGTERHESRRIDNQLRGRSGRQGDAGASIFFLSVEDDLMRIFGSDKMEMLLSNKTIGLKEGEALSHAWISKALERAQTKVESMNFDIRKNLLKFDDVMNDQRKVIYEQRRDLMAADTIEEMVKDIRHSTIDDLVHSCMPPKTYPDQWDLDTLQTEVARLFTLDLPIQDWAKEEGVDDALVMERITDAADKMFASKAIDISPELYHKLEKALVLQLLDQAWKEHLLNLDHLRQGISLRAVGQRDPLNEYKTEAFAMFEGMLDQFREAVTHTLSLVEFNIEEETGQLLFRRHNPAAMQETRKDPALENKKLSDEQLAIVTPFPQKSDKPFDKNDPTTWGKVQRNATCPCGSGKKYKHCHGKVS